MNDFSFCLKTFLAVGDFKSLSETDPVTGFSLLFMSVFCDLRALNTCSFSPVCEVSAALPPFVTLRIESMVIVER